MHCNFALLLFKHFPGTTTSSTLSQYMGILIHYMKANQVYFVRYQFFPSWACPSSWLKAALVLWCSDVAYITYRSAGFMFLSRRHFPSNVLVIYSQALCLGLDLAAVSIWGINWPIEVFFSYPFRLPLYLSTLK